MQVVDIPINQLKEADWNPNQLDQDMLNRLEESLHRFKLIQNLVVRATGNGNYQVLSGNQRLQVLKELGYITVPCVVVDLDDAHARLLSQALNHIHVHDNLGLRAELIREVLEQLPQEEILSILPETSESLKTLSSLGQEEMAEFLANWQRAQVARLKHLQFQLTSAQLEVIEEALQRMVPMTRENMGDSPNARGTALFLLCKELLERNVTP